MKVEYLTFNRYATELHLQSLLTERDVSRAERSLKAKGDGFIHDLTTLASDIRLALSRKHFVLSEHTNRVFERLPKSVLPRFLGGALRKVFADNGEFLESPDSAVCAQLLMFCDSLKRTDPHPRRRPSIEEKLWSGLRERFENAPQVAGEIATRMRSDAAFCEFILRVRQRFKEILSKADLSRPIWGIGPGKNLDRYEASTSADWYMTHDSYYGPASAPITRFVRMQMNRTPFQRRRDLNAARLHKKQGRRLHRPDTTMKCSAQPKSNKALRGVGVMHAGRMAAQITLQRIFYRDCLSLNMPLNDQDLMKENLRENWAEIGTIDLSNASDLCYWFLLRFLGHGDPWFDAAFELRTETLILPTGSVGCASPVMGEAITFPLMSAFFTAIALTVCDDQGSGHEYVRVYGDDIQTKWYYETIARLQELGLRVSVDKSYPPDSYFKESCEAHYIKIRDHLVPCRPCYLPTAYLNRRGRCNHVDAYRLLVLAKDSWLRNPALSEAACKVVEERTSIKLPVVPVFTSLLGRQSISSRTHGVVELQTHVDESHPLSARGAMRKLLAAAGSEQQGDLKLIKKREYLMTLRTIKKLKVRDTLRDLENEIFVRIGWYANPEMMTELERRQVSIQDMRSWVQANVSEDDICAGIALIRELIQQVKLK